VTPVPAGAPAPASLATVFARSEGVVARVIADECILVPLARGGANLEAIYELNSVGAFIWERLDGSSSGAAVVAALAAIEAIEARCPMPGQTSDRGTCLVRNAVGSWSHTRVRRGLSPRILPSLT
jgi:hypothetical protein